MGMFDMFNMARTNQLQQSSGQIYDALIKAGYPPEEAIKQSSGFATQQMQTANPTKAGILGDAGQGWNNMWGGVGGAISGKLWSLDNRDRLNEAYKQSGINPNSLPSSQPITPSSTTTGLLAKHSAAQPQGDWLSQLGGYFQDRPAFTQGLLTAGIAAGAGAPAWMIGATGGQAMQQKQNQMATAAQTAQENQFKNLEAYSKIWSAEAEFAKANMTNKITWPDAVKMAIDKGGDMSTAKEIFDSVNSGKMPNIQVNKGGSPWPWMAHPQSIQVAPKAY
jgi:hypothetical protein